MVAAPLPMILVTDRISDKNLSTPISRAIPATGTIPNAESVDAIVIKPPPVIVAAPFEFSIKMKRI